LIFVNVARRKGVGGFAMQSLMLVTKDAEGGVRTKSLSPVRFVPLLEADPTTQAGK